ncbi:hypothetical protein JZ751_022226 [Albula glossodonta]|uniref:Uncharacterized protein n=1 Tax=Albula glossodonta TaxID=121402 RepID=A0A8T2NH30_9TELE|nr:hypothetical protein JZ751_022226 [Albula glossodonta]
MVLSILDLKIGVLLVLDDCGSLSGSAGLPNDVDQLEGVTDGAVRIGPPRGPELPHLQDPGPAGVPRNQEVIDVAVDTGGANLSLSAQNGLHQSIVDENVLLLEKEEAAPNWSVLKVDDNRTHVLSPGLGGLPHEGEHGQGIVRLVIMTITPTLLSHTILQKSSVLDFRGPWAAM